MTTYRTVTYSTCHAQPHDYQLTDSNHADYSGPQELLDASGHCSTGLLYNSDPMNMTTTIVDGTMTLTYWTCVALASIDSMLSC